MKVFPHSLRLRLVVTAIVIELVTLAALVANSIRVSDQALADEAQTWVRTTGPLLNAALAVPLAQRNYATIAALLAEMRSEQGLQYLVLLDHRGSVVAAAGREPHTALPPPDPDVDHAGGDGRFDLRMPISVAGATYGMLAIGVSTESLARTRATLLAQSLLVGGIGVSASLVLLTLLALWLTRNLRSLTDAGTAIAHGDFSARVPVGGADEVGMLSAAFNTMAQATQDKIDALAEGEARLSHALRELEKANAVQREYLAQASDERARLNALLSAMQIGILLVDRDNKVIYSNPAFEQIWLLSSSRSRLVGMDAAVLMTQTFDPLSRSEGLPEKLVELARTGTAAPPVEIETSDGRVIHRSGFAVRDGDGQPVGYLWLFEDVTRERQTANQILYLAERDALTGLFNRHRFQEELARMLSGSERRRRRVALLFFDLDEFKHVNDTFGHRAGDALLIRVAGEVSAQVRRNEVFARLGGDEFAILAPDIPQEEAQAFAERIVRTIARIPFTFEGQSVRLTCSLGLAIFPEHASNAEDLVSHADAAMYQAKEAGKNTWRIYREDAQLSRRMLARLSWNERIEDALEHELLRLHFQGVFGCATGELCHVEALVRMLDREDPSRTIMPGSFIPVAEKTGKILDIDRWVVMACVQALARHPRVSAIALNVSGRSLSEPTLPRFITEQLAAAGVHPARLIVELTETSAVSDLHDAQRFIEQLREAGCRVCLDDFGSGFSSFAYLKHLDVDMLKIDGQFIRELASDRNNQVFVRAIVDVARGLRKITVAECVEDAASLEMLRAFGVDCAQGYFLERPTGDHPWMRPAAADA
jgi:diguanylate cyclase (GGDEF)-like protein/PAS domain S-box-containing protein